MVGIGREGAREGAGPQRTSLKHSEPHAASLDANWSLRSRPKESNVHAICIGLGKLAQSCSEDDLEI